MDEKSMQDIEKETVNPQPEEAIEKKENYKKKLRAWQEEHGMVSQILYSNRFQLGSLEYIESAIKDFLSPYQIDSHYPIQGLDVQRWRASKHHYQLHIAGVDTLFIGLVDVKFHNEDSGGVKDTSVTISCMGGEPGGEELYRVARELLEGLALRFGEIYWKGNNQADDQMHGAEAKIDSNPARRVPLDIRERRSQVSSLWTDKGLTDSSIALKLAVHVSTVRRDRKALGLVQMRKT